MLSFVNTFSPALPSYLQPGILQAEQGLSLLNAANDVIRVTFDYASLGPGIAAENNFNTVTVSYAQLKAALVSHAVTPDAQLAVAGLPTADPSAGAGFELPVAYAQHLGLASASMSQGLTVTLNSDLTWGNIDDLAAALQHELTEGGFGRIASLGLEGQATWSPMDLFRFLAGGTRDVGGNPAQFGLDANNLSALTFDEYQNPDGTHTHRDLGDWAIDTNFDAFGPGGPGSNDVLSATDKVMMQALGYTPVSQPTDDHGNAPGASGVGGFDLTGHASGTFEYLADHDVFSGLLPGLTYQVQMTGSGGVAPRLDIVDASGAILTERVAASTGAASVQVTVPANGAAQYVEAVSRMDSGAGTGGYSLALSITGTTLPASVAAQEFAVLRTHATDVAAASITSSLAVGLGGGALTLATAETQIVQAAASTSSVATLAYQFFTGATPSSGGMDFLVNPTGPNANNLNSAYYQSFGLENRYINFAVALGSGQGAGATGFANLYANDSLSQTLTLAYQLIFGATPSADKVGHILNDLVPDGTGGQYARSNYFAYYGGDGLTGVGTKAAMVGWLLAEAVKADVGDYALSNDALLHAVAQGTGSFGVNLIGAYDQQSFHYTGP